MDTGSEVPDLNTTDDIIAVRCEVPAVKGKDQLRSAKDMFQQLSNMGKETITSETSEWAEFTKTISSMNESIKCLQNDVRTIKRSRPDMTDDPIPGAKRFRPDSPESHSAEDIDCYLSDGDEKGASDGADEEWEDITDFFIEETDYGDPIPEKLATLVNKSLRCKTNKEKMKALMEKYIRPENVPNLQVPKVDEVLWNQLRTEIKASDFGQQNLQRVLCRALVPVIRLMEHVKHQGSKDVKELVGDIFKILAQGVVTSNEHRREKIKQNLLPNFKKLCENPPSATKLFGDKLDEDIKKMKEAKPQLTHDRPHKHFLLKKGGGNRQQPYNKRTTAYPPRYNQPSKNHYNPRKQHRMQAQKRNRK